MRTSIHATFANHVIVNVVIAVTTDTFHLPLVVMRDEDVHSSVGRELSDEPEVSHQFNATCQFIDSHVGLLHQVRY